MRFKRLDLIRYGKFTGQSLDFPAGEPDFHLLIGPNEAGKSTLRTAVLDLLFGFPHRTPLDFLHAKSDLRLGAVVQRADTVMEFQRVKANRNTLRGAEDSILPDHALDSWLGGAQRAFFDKMFGLDHERLMSGGNNILNAQDDVGQVLFQSASGIASLGKVRDALQAEADTLWAPTKSTRRSYYIARDLYDEASADLKNATVRARDWAAANERLQKLESDLDAHRRERSLRHEVRTRLERSRRVMPLLDEIAACEREIQALQGSVLLPAEASQVVGQAQLAMARAGQRIEIHRNEQARLSTLAASVHVDETVLGMADEIDALETMRHRYAGHEAAIAQAYGQAELLRSALLRMSQELGWPTDTSPSADLHTFISSRIPGLPLREHLARLLKEHDKICLAVDAVRLADLSRQAEVRAAEARLREHAIPEASTELRSAVAQAEDLGDTEQAMSQANARLQRCQAALAQAMARLGDWARPPEALASVSWPAAPTVSAWIAERHACAADLKSLAARCEDHAALVERTSLSVTQFKQRHQPVTMDDVHAARAGRDALWRAMRGGVESMEAAADRFESSVMHADIVADQRHDKAREAAEFQNLEHQLEQERSVFHAMTRRYETCASTLKCLDQAWQQQAESLALHGMALEALPDWLTRKDVVVDAAHAVNQAHHERRELVARHEQVKAVLTRALSLQGASVDGNSTVATLRTRAQSCVREADDARVRRQTWQDDLVKARAAQQAAAQALHEAEGRLDGWRLEWHSAAKRAGLPPDTPLGEAAGAVQLFSELQAKLDELRRVQHEQIDARRAELQDFTATALVLAGSAGVTAERTSIEPDTAAAVSRELARRLAQARQARQHAADLARSIEQERVAFRAAEEGLAEAQAQVQPLLERAGASDLSALSDAIVRSDRLRALQGRVQEAEKRLSEDGDGVSRERLHAEVVELDPARIPAELALLQQQIAESQEAQSALAVELDRARAELAAIAGADDAARAEARRQEALAAMGEAASRYVKVYTAERLLRWSIDRYREEKQGPVLTRASEIFKDLTLGAFDRLRVDFDREPMVLQGQRSDGSLVGVGGLSDGTRDQLYLALRLAALEMHLEQAEPLPFIADDLFINYDDGRTLAGLQALAELSRHTQVIFLSHHDHMADLARSVFGDRLNLSYLGSEVEGG